MLMVSTNHMSTLLRTRSVRVISILCVIVSFAPAVHGCSCGGDYRGRNLWEIAQKRVEAADAVFEGTVKKIGLRIPVIAARSDETISADESFGQVTEIAFEVSRVYKGKLAGVIVLHTSFGGGDCGARFSPGIAYLVYAYGPDMEHLSVSLCSPGGWVESESVAPDLRFLRGQHATKRDLTTWSPLWRRSREEQDEYTQHLLALRDRVTGKICGTVDRRHGTISFLSSSGSSPGDHPTSSVGEDGKFCSNSLGPGSYYLLYTDGGSRIFFPGVSELSTAKTIDVRAGQTRNDISFKVAQQHTYTVRGFITTNSKTGLGSQSVFLALIPVEAPVREAMNFTTVDFTTRWPLPKTKYFNFENVVPGQYVVWVQVAGKGWHTQKQEFTVSNSSKIITLELQHDR